MEILLAPAKALMQRLRLLPKFMLVTLLFAAPSLLVGSLLLSELNKLVSHARQEQQGVSQVRHLMALLQLVERHRALRHMALSGNPAAGEAAMQTASAIHRALASHEFKGHGGTDDSRQAWQRNWSALLAAAPGMKAKESDVAHSTLIDRLIRLIGATADQSGLSVDPELASLHLGNVLVRTYPGLADALAQLAGRGAAFIDTGLLEANEDLLLHSLVTVTRRDLARLPSQFDAIVDARPELRSGLTEALEWTGHAMAFLDRAQSEVVNSYNQTAGMQFFEHGDESIGKLFASSEIVARSLEDMLRQRIERDTRRRALVLVFLLVALATAAYLLAGFFAAFSGEAKQLEYAVDRTAAGDLRQRVASRGRDEIASLVNAFGGMSTRLAGLVSEVRAGSDSVATAARAIADGNADLSARTEAQASSLEQTASAMEELTSIVRQNSANASEASRLAACAVDVACRGGAAVDQVNETMHVIENDTARMIDIICLIDEIGFQINLLALNAAVEAAHAGEHGRGFAVVAGEVRALAQRSAGAAREIKSLIDDSVARVKDGSRLAGTASGTMRDIVTSVRQVADLLSGIAVAGKEQAAGIEQINHAIRQMDESTQHNAALVEQSATAAGALHDQADRLTRAVSAFRLEHETEVKTVGAAVDVQRRFGEHHNTLLPFEPA